jgi:hypothetical protein
MKIALDTLIPNVRWHFEIKGDRVRHWHSQRSKRRLIPCKTLPDVLRIRDYATKVDDSVRLRKVVRSEFDAKEPLRMWRLLFRCALGHLKLEDRLMISTNLAILGFAPPTGDLFLMWERAKMKRDDRNLRRRVRRKR